MRCNIGEQKNNEIDDWDYPERVYAEIGIYFDILSSLESRR